MKKIVQIILMVLGVVFLIQLGLMTWFYVADPLHIFSGETIEILVPATATSSEPGESRLIVEDEEVSTASVSTSSTPSQAQVEAAKAMGVTIPTFTDEQISCFEKIFGASRVEEIKGGAVPTAYELYQGRSCL